MNCPKCQHPNADGARFCAQCGAAFAQAAPPSAAMPNPAVPAAQPSSGSKTVLIVLGAIVGVVLLFVIGAYTFFHVAANEVRSLAAGDTQQGAQATGNVIGSLLGTDSKGKSDIASALNDMTQAGQQIEQHDESTGNADGAPDASDTQQAMGAVGGLLSALGNSLGGAHRHDPVDFHTLETLLPTSLAGLQRGTPRGEANQAMGIKATSADVEFSRPNGARIQVSIKDATAVSGLAGLAEMANANESEQGGNYERNETLDGHNVHEKWDAPGKHGELSLIVAKRYGVDVTGDGVDMEALKSALAQVDLDRLESMKDANPKAQ